MEYLLGYNQPWDTNPNLPEKYIDPAVAAKYWGEYFIPIAKELGLKLVSPTSTFMDTKKTDWLVTFLKSCWELRDAEENACDVETIEVFAMHHYTCYY